MELPPFDDISKIWAPTKNEIRDLCRKSKYVQMHGHLLLEDAAEDKTPTKVYYQNVKIDAPVPMTSQELPVPAMPWEVQIMEEEAIILSVMLKREGLYEVPNVPSCIVCATEKLERDLMELMRRELEITKLAREFYSQPENDNKYMCAKHRPFNPQNCVPFVNGIQPNCRFFDPLLTVQSVRGHNENTPLVLNHTDARAPLNLPQDSQLDVERFAHQLRTQANFEFLNEIATNPNKIPTLNHHYHAQPQDDKHLPDLYPAERTNAKIFPNANRVQSIPPAGDRTYLPPNVYSVQSGSTYTGIQEMSMNELMARENAAHAQNGASNFIPIQSTHQSNYLINNEIHTLPQNNIASASNHVHNNINMEIIERVANQIIAATNYVPTRDISQNGFNHMPSFVPQSINLATMRQNIAQNVATEEYRNPSRGRKILGKRFNL